MCCWTDLIKLRLASSIRESTFAIVVHVKDVEKKGIRILFFIICLHSLDALNFWERFRVNSGLRF